MSYPCEKCGAPTGMVASLCGVCCDRAMEIQNHGWGDPLGWDAADDALETTEPPAEPGKEE